MCAHCTGSGGTQQRMVSSDALGLQWGSCRRAPPGVVRCCCHAGCLTPVCSPLLIRLASDLLPEPQALPRPAFCQCAELRPAIPPPLHRAPGTRLLKRTGESSPYRRSGHCRCWRSHCRCGRSGHCRCGAASHTAAQQRLCPAGAHAAAGCLLRWWRHSVQRAQRRLLPSRPAGTAAAEGSAPASLLSATCAFARTLLPLLSACPQPPSVPFATALLRRSSLVPTPLPAHFACSHQT